MLPVKKLSRQITYHSVTSELMLNWDRGLPNAAAKAGQGLVGHTAEKVVVHKSMQGLKLRFSHDLHD